MTEQRAPKQTNVSDNRAFIEFGFYLLLVVAIGWLDDITGPKIAFSLFYFIPVALTGWRVGYAGTAITAIAATACWFWGERGMNEIFTVGEFAWRTITRGITFVFIGAAMATIKLERKRLIEIAHRFKTIAHTDMLTDMPNRLALVEMLQQEIEGGAANQSPMCVLLIDLDNYKQVNTVYGYSTGDIVLRKIADALKGCVRHSDTTARISGDEFAAIVRSVNTEEAKNIAQRFSLRLGHIANEYPKATIRATNVVVYFNSPPQSVDDLLNNAYKALIEAKQKARGSSAMWSSRERKLDMLGA